MPDINHKKRLAVYDSTLRDGSHALGNSLNKKQIQGYARIAEQAGIPFLEIGHGLGIGASSLQSGFSTLTDREIIESSLPELTNTRLCCFFLPGYATIKRDVKPALDQGVKTFRIGCHCTEANVTLRYIEYMKAGQAMVFVSFVMSHMATKQQLLEQARMAKNAGADGIILMDSAGHFLPQRTGETAAYLRDNLDIPLGFHAHNNLGMAAANVLASIENGFGIVDGCCCGLGAASGNAQLEMIVTLLEANGYHTGIDIPSLFELAEYTRRRILREIPFSNPLNIVSGMHGITSAFASHIEKAAREFGVEPVALCEELAKFRPVAGQEDLIIETAVTLKSRQERHVVHG